MVTEAHTARFLATDQDITGPHEARDVLESDRCDVEREAEARAEPVDLHPHGEALRDLAAPSSDLHEVPHEECENLVRRDVAARPGHGPEPIPITVHGDPEVRTPGAHFRGELVEVGRNRLGMKPAEE